MMTANPPEDEPYLRADDYQWTVKAFEMVERGDLQGEVVSHEGVVRSRVWGHCPRCGDLVDDRQTHTALTNLMGGTRGLRSPGPGEAGSGNESEWFFPVDISCACDHAHPGAPPDASGCGVSFRVEFAVTDDGAEQ
jgi:hypothetical protein